jgi:hypothetical protein
MNAKDTLIKARALLADPARWTQHALALARDAAGESHPPNHPRSSSMFWAWEGIEGNDPAACSWCAIGALQHVTRASIKPFNLLTDAAETIYDLCITDVNDKLGHDAVLEIYDHAIKAS